MIASAGWSNWATASVAEGTGRPPEMRVRSDPATKPAKLIGRAPAF